MSAKRIIPPRAWLVCYRLIGDMMRIDAGYGALVEVEVEVKMIKMKMKIMMKILTLCVCVCVWL
jgi:hypothetical protein